MNFFTARFKIVLGTAVIAGFLALLPIAHTFASTSDVNADCTITRDDVAIIKAIQNDPKLSYDEKVQQELAARKTLLAKTINCAESEVSRLRDVLQAIPTADSASTNIASQISGKLSDANNYYELERGKLADAGIVGTEQIAKEIVTWRTSVFVPLGSQVNSFGVWAKNQPLFAAATARMAQVSRIVSFLAATNDNDLATAFAKAQASFRAAQDGNTATQRAIIQSLSSDQIATLTRQSLQSLADTYQNFFSISTIIQGVNSANTDK